VDALCKPRLMCQCHVFPHLFFDAETSNCDSSELLAFVLRCYMRLLESVLEGQSQQQDC